MLRKPCIICGVPATGSRCPAHEEARQHALSRQERGYDADYDRGVRGVRAAARAAWAAGREVQCVICKMRIPNPESELVNHKSRLTVEHITPKRDGGSNEPANLGPAHAACNYGWRRQRRGAR